MIRENQRSIIQKILEDCYKNTLELDFLKLPIGLFEGGAGIAFFHMVYEFNYSTNKKIGQIEIKSILENRTIMDGSFCNGASGILWALTKLNKNGLIDIDDSIIISIKEFCLKSLIKYLRNTNNDFLHGAFGVLYSLLNSACLDGNDIELLLSTLKKNIPISKIFKTNFSSIPTKKEHLNLHLAHGIASYIITLCEFYKVTKNKFIQEIVVQHINILLSNYMIGQKSIFPFAHGMRIRNVRNAWCYGDLGIGLAFYTAGCVFNESYYTKVSKDIFGFSLTKTNLKKDGVRDFSVCHGLMGNLLIYSKICDKIMVEEDSVIIDVYLNKVLSYYNRYGKKSFYHKENDIYTEKFGILQGYAGIGLTCLTLLGRETFSWEEILLL